MKFSLNSFYQKLQLLQHNGKKTWNIFSFTPARYWYMATITFVVFLSVFLCVDAFLFWRLVIAFEQNSYKTDSTYIRLERESLEAALSLLREREIYFQGRKDPLPIRDIFATPPPPAKQE